MKRYSLSMADSFRHVPEHPERTAKRSAGTGLNFDVIYQVWPSREAMLTTIRMQERRVPKWSDWKAG
jgi:hypothetical protein